MAQFRTKARAVDLLGKGQIADLPTAITELWKNGYDAYADKVKLSIFKKGYENLAFPILTISDDGKGMTKKEIFEKWLVLGTDSKSRNEVDVKGVETLWKEPRIKAGEKGIGRLSIAFIGSPMLMLTKKIGSKLQALFFDWRILENYNLFLEDIHIPIEDVTNSTNLKKIFSNLKEKYLKNFEKVVDDEEKPIWEGKQIKLKEDIITDTDNAILPSFLLDDEFINLFEDKTHGTIFIIFNPDSQILDIISDSNSSEKTDAEFVRGSLLAFTNTFSENKLPLEYEIPIFSSDIDKRDFLTSGGEFFVPKDFEIADIVIDGALNGQGDFIGKLKIYDKYIDYNEKINPRKKFAKTNYGNCKVKLGYSLGERKDSKLNETLFNKLTSKVSNYGGIYIFRDGFRVLPYGRAREDFLGLEERRSKHAGQYFFSYRRLFGFIAISRDGNPDLIDKAGREGLINNSWYRAFSEDLEGLFISLAKDFFSNKAKQSVFLDTKEQLNQQVDALNADKKRVTEEKKQFTRDLKLYPDRLQEYKKKYQDLVKSLSKKLSESKVVYGQIESLITDIKKMDLAYKDLLPEIPKHYKPTERQLERLDEYEQAIIDFTETTKKKSSDLFEKVDSLLEIHELQKEFEHNYIIYKNKLEEESLNYSETLSEKLSEIASEYHKRTENLVKSLTAAKEKLLTNIHSKKGVIESSKKLNEEYNLLLKFFKEKIIPAVDHIRRIDFDIDEELVKGAYRTAYDEMKEQWELTNEMAQLGIAVEIIDHEFNVLYSAINNSIKDLEPKITGITGASKRFSHLKNAFQQLEEKYELLSPLYRAAGIIEKEINGLTIFEYLKSFFQNSLEKEKIEIIPSDAFIKCKFISKEPVVYAVFINLINNAIYWLRSKEDKKIIFDFYEKTQEILVMNSGEKIKDYQLKKIFELFYSKRGGRGLGLYLAMKSLQKSLMDIYATNSPKYNRLNGACFVIKLNNIDQ